tara:strand:- start:63 stop:689 length:627 start_codon:yes stop_codon:yes gene_type:complete
MKKCNNCKLEKEYSFFNKNKRTNDDYSNTCRECMKIINNKSYINNKEKSNSDSKSWYKLNREKHIEHTSNYQKQNPEKNRLSTAKYLKNNPEYYNNYRRNRYKTDPQFKLRIILGNRINSALKSKKHSKIQSTLILLGCTLEELQNHLEKQFKEEMNWSNHGSYWEVDHIMPCSSFNLINIEQQKLCFNYTNLQPLTVTQNRQKSNKV